MEYYDDGEGWFDRCGFERNKERLCKREIVARVRSNKISAVIGLCPEHLEKIEEQVQAGTRPHDCIQYLVPEENHEGVLRYLVEVCRG